MRASSIAAVIALAAGHVAAQSAITESTWQNIVQYTRFARASYAATCATPPNGSVVLNYINDAPTDGHATLFRYDAAKQIVLSFRGTYTPQNWDSDLDFGSTALTIAGTSCSSCNVHTGFQKVYNGIAAQVLSAVNSAIAANPGYTLILTGHSLGGALASLGTVALGARGIKIAATYTYGEPRNGNSALSTYLYTFVPLAKYFRVTHSNDGVPQVPPAFLGFTHHGNEYWQKATGYNNTAATTVLCAPPATGENTNCDLGQRNDIFINYAHVTYTNDVIGNTLHVHDCGAPYP